MLWLIGVLLIGLIISPKVVMTDELQEVMEKYALTEEKLDEFENEELVSNVRSRRNGLSLNKPQMLSEYNLLIEQGILEKDITFDMYIQLNNVKPPTDPVVSYSGPVAGNPQAGDIMITNGTSLNGLTGHAGIFLNNGTILSIEGPGKTPRALSIIEWAQKYMSKKGQWTKYIDRHQDTNLLVLHNGV